MRICFCDDEASTRSQFERMAAAWAEQRGEAAELQLYNSAEQLLFEVGQPEAQELVFDLILLDIQMGGMDGITLARQLRAQDKRVTLAFLTAAREYVFEGYEVKALRYLIKPVQDAALFSILDEIQSADQRFVLLNGSRINLNDLIYVEAEAHYCHLVFEDHRQKEKIGIRELKTMLDETFVMIHRSYLVNIAKVDQIRREDLSASSFTLPIARSQLKIVNEAFIRYNKGTRL